MFHLVGTQNTAGAEPNFLVLEIRLKKMPEVAAGLRVEMSQKKTYAEECVKEQSLRSEEGRRSRRSVRKFKSPK